MKLYVQYKGQNMASVS